MAIADTTFYHLEFIGEQYDRKLKRGKYIFHLVMQKWCISYNWIALGCLSFVFFFLTSLLECLIDFFMISAWHLVASVWKMELYSLEKTFEQPMQTYILSGCICTCLCIFILIYFNPECLQYKGGKRLLKTDFPWLNCLEHGERCFVNYTVDIFAKKCQISWLLKLITLCNPIPM